MAYEWKTVASVLAVPGRSHEQTVKDVQAARDAVQNVNPSAAAASYQWHPHALTDHGVASILLAFRI